MESSSHETRPIWIAAFDALAVGSFALVWTLLGIQVASDAGTIVAVWIFAAALPVGYAIADAASGLVHWFADSFFEEDAPILGPLLIAPFREHHRDAKAITHHGFLEICGNNCAVCLLLLIPLWALAATGAFASVAAAVAVSLLLSTTFFVFATNGFHRWAHADETPRWVGWLQRRGLILSPEEHAKHHEGGHDLAYCVTSGWMNPIFDRTGVLRRIRASANAHRSRARAH